VELATELKQKFSGITSCDRKMTAASPTVPPTARPGHRFYERKRASRTKARAMRAAKFVGAMRLNFLACDEATC
jgi:hypothetical protein